MFLKIINNISFILVSLFASNIKCNEDLDAQVEDSERMARFDNMFKTSALFNNDAANYLSKAKKKSGKKNESNDDNNDSSDNTKDEDSD